MRRKAISITIIFVVFVLLVFPDSFNWDRYKPSTMDEIIKYASRIMDDEKDFTFTTDFPAFKIKLQYTGKFQKTGDEMNRFFELFAKVFRRNENAHEVFTNEACFKDGNTEYWFPIQSVLIPYLKEEILVDGYVELYVIFFGYVKEQIVLTVNEFRKVNE